jgi:hypothetical protein
MHAHKAFLAWTPSAIVLISCRFFLAVRFAARVRTLNFCIPVEVYPPPADYPKSFSLLDLRFVEKGAEVYSKG